MTRDERAVPRLLDVDLHTVRMQGSRRFEARDRVLRTATIVPTMGDDRGASF
ncbi:hypothetical protein DEJ15_01820 [Curtobacterium sp. MCJR17_043]|nr:hypothetical protein [Curtobacterium sp. MCJR17_043]WIB36046.1 hypothetical protein DEJ15_01820 [Curtobacterium sp. MCJR17_043]